MKYKFCSIRINVTKYDVTFATKGVLTPTHCSTCMSKKKCYCFGSRLFSTNKSFSESFWNSSDCKKAGYQKGHFFGRI